LNVLQSFHRDELNCICSTRMLGCAFSVERLVGGRGGSNLYGQILENLLVTNKISVKMLNIQYSWDNMSNNYWTKCLYLFTKIQMSSKTEARQTSLLFFILCPIIYSSINLILYNLMWFVQDYWCQLSGSLVIAATMLAQC
jgi:hypothetical protein